MDEATNEDHNITSEFSEDDAEKSDNFSEIQEGFEWDNMGTDILSRDTRPDKRCRKDSDENEEGFTTVTRRKPKRIARSNSLILPAGSTAIQGTRGINENDEKIFEICISSKEELPKQIAMAKLLQSKSIQNVLRIKYKNPYKALIRFDSKENAEKLFGCQEIAKLGYRCQFTDEINLSYGIVKQVEVDINEAEIQKTFQCDFDIISAKRLKRLTHDGKWTESETIRLCFKSPTLPPFVFAHGCRFKVEPYTFPVTQCSGCWKFGHLIRACPTKKVLCPKCGDEHVNCEINHFRCLNCKGAHTSFDKSCPVFLKEKKIRSIMSTDNCTYRKALWVFLANKKDENVTKESPIIQEHVVFNQHNQEKSYRDVLITKAQEEENQSSEEILQEKHTENNQICLEKRGSLNKEKRKKYKQRQLNNNREVLLTTENQQMLSETDNIQNKSEAKNEERLQTLKKLLQKAKEIIFSDLVLEDKIKQVLTILYEQLLSFIKKSICSSDVIIKVFSMFVNGDYK